MSTSAEFSNITSKRVMGFEDFGTRMLSYLQNLCRGTISHAYLNGSFLEAMGLSSPGADQVQMDLKTGGAGDVHDGLGNILDLSLVTRSAVFENTNAVDYEVGAGYIAKPSGIQNNPVYGFPEYVKYIEDVGEEAEPDEVTDNGNGTITFRVDSVTQANEDNSGRTVRVFKKVPADGALTPAIAIEECTVAYGGGENTITTTGDLGQSTVSTTASDYLVQLVGISIRRASGNPISTSGVHFFAGVVTGNGGTPTAFDTSGQNILEANAANQISVIPFTGPSPLSWDIAATTVQDALEEIVSDISSDGGDQYVNVSNDNFSYTNPVATGDSGGFYNVGIESLSNFAEEVEWGLLTRRVGTATLSDGTQRSACDWTGSYAAQSIQTLANGGTFWVQYGTGNLQFYPGQYTLGGASHLPRLIGEVKTGGHNGYQTVILGNGGSNDLYLRGHFERLHFYSGDYNNYIQLRFGGTNQDTTYTDCGFDAGHIRHSGNDSEERPVVMRHCEVGIGTGPGPGAASFECQRVSTGYWPHFIAENCVFRGPHSSATSQWGVLYIDDFGDETTQYTQLKSKGFKFKNCLFIHDNFNAMPTVWVGSSAPQEVTFEDCIFIGKAGQTEPVFWGSGSKVNMKNCSIYAPSGQALLMEDCEGTLENVFILSGTDTSVTDPQLVACSGRYTNDMARPLFIKNMKIKANAGCIRNGTTPTLPMVEMGGNGNDYDGGPVHVDGLDIQIPYNTSLHDHSTLVLRNVENAVKTYPEGVRGPNTFKNIHIDCGYSADTPGTNSQAHIVQFLNDDYPDVGRPIVSNFTMTNIAKPAGANTTNSVIYSYGFNAEDIFLGFNSGGAGTSYSFGSAINMQRGDFHRVKITAINSYDDQLIVSDAILRGNHQARFFDVDMSECWGVYFSSANAHIYLTGDDSACIRAKFPTGSDYDSSVKGIYATGTRVHVKDNVWNNWTVAPSEPFIVGRDSAGEHVVTGNIIHARSGGDDYIDLGTGTDCPRSIMMCNVMHSTITGNPTWVNGSNDSKGGDTQNVVSDA